MEPLSQMEVHFREAARHIPVLCWMCRNDRSRAHFSGAWAAYTGRTFHDGEWRQCIHPDDRPQFDGLTCNCDHDGAHREVRIASKTGEYRWHRVTCTPVDEDDGPAKMHIFVALDIEDERRALNDVVHVRERFSMATEAAKVGVFEIDIAGRRVSLNDRAARIFGVPLTELECDLDTMRSRIVPEDRIEVEQAIESALRGEQASVQLGYRVRHPDGEERQVRSYSLISSAHDGETKRLYGAVYDWTDAYLDRKSLTDYKNRLEATYENAGVGICEVGPDARIQQVNTTFCTMTGLSREGAIGMRLVEVFAPSEHDAIAAQFDSIMGEEVERVEETHSGHNAETGLPIWMITRMTPVLDEQGEFDYAVCVLSDITELQIKRDQEKVLLAELTHRVKNTIATVQSIATQTAPEEDDFRETFLGRLHAISAVHARLVEGHWFGESLSAILETVLRQRQVTGRHRWSLNGPLILINPSAAVNLGLILHELAYNSESYGALSGDTGTIAITWSVEDGPNESVLLIKWRESGGPKVIEPDYRGFGTRLCTSFSRHLSGRYVPEYLEDGLVVTLEIPTTTILATIGAGMMRL